MLSQILEKYVDKIYDGNQDRFSQEELKSFLFEFLEAVVDDVRRYDFMGDEMIKHPQGEFIRYDSIHS